MAKRSIGSLMRKKLSDITNSHSHSHYQSQSQEDNNPLDPFPTDKDCIQQLLKIKNLNSKMIEKSGAEVHRMRADIKKLQLQNWNLAQSNSHMLAELNLGRERIKALQHEILWRAALLKGNTREVQEKVEIDYEKNASFSRSQERDEKVGQPSPEASNDEQHSYMNRRRIRSRSTGSSTASTKNASKDNVKDNRRRSRRHSATFKTHQLEPLENLFEIEDANYLVTQSRPNMLSSVAVKDETGESSILLRKEAPRSSFGRPLRRAVQKVQTYKEIPLNIKLRRLE
ncbi:SHUGOSHIN 2 [Gastrolobium bilobum]|uniref:SHUGOSHIN 2 n=1 Tax=Gastrolobium bilobum TaxID=150636 RepID=UPI002AB0A2FE|nr:SHUGOSHIN 2 [Gastrolobium bilobum]